VHDHEQLAHYANAALDLEFKFAFGYKELEGIHSRTDFDLSRHQEFSGKKLQVYDHEKEESYVPYVVETSVGLDRLFLAVMTRSLVEEEVPDAEGKTSTRVVLKLPPALAPVKVAILPLLKNKEELTDMAQSIFNKIRAFLPAQYDEKDAIGRRYRRQDAIGTPYCVTVDFESLEDNTVTLRDRDSLKQERIAVDDILDRVQRGTSMEKMLSGLIENNGK
jgi:glycyl-tRNA synthetase